MGRKKSVLQKKDKRGRFQKKRKGWRREGARKPTGKIPEKHAFGAKNVVK